MEKEQNQNLEKASSKKEIRNEASDSTTDYNEVKDEKSIKNTFKKPPSPIQETTRLDFVTFFTISSLFSHSNRSFGKQWTAKPGGPGPPKPWIPIVL